MRVELDLGTHGSYTHRDVDTHERERFLLRLNAHAGDVLMARPVLRAFRKSHPSARIYFETARRYHGLLSGQADADFVRDLFVTKGMPAIDLCEFKKRPWASQGVHLMDWMAHTAGVKVIDRSYGFVADAADDQWAQKEARNLGPFAVLHTTSTLPSKDWAPGRMAELRSLLSSEFGLASVQVGGGTDLPIPGAVDQRGLPLGRAAALMSRAAVFIGPDSLPMHLSRAIRPVPAVVVWGASSPVTSGLFGPNVVNLDPQRGCAHDGRACYSRCDFSSACSHTTTTEDVLRAAARLVEVTPRPDVTVILVNWNSWARYTHPTLNALVRTMKSDWEVVLVDNGSKEDGPHLAHWTHPKVMAKILNPKNLGLPVAWNQAVRVSKGRNLLFLNTDIEILRDGWDLEAIEVLARHPEAGVVGISENEAPGLFGPGLEKCSLPIREGHDTPCHLVNGSAMLVSRDAIDRIGPFDENFTPGYCEETDFCLRACLQGVGVRHLGGFIRHEGHKVTAILNRLPLGPIIEKNGVYFRKKWEGVRIPPIDLPVPQSPARSPEEAAV